MVFSDHIVVDMTRFFLRYHYKIIFDKNRVYWIQKTQKKFFVKFYSFLASVATFYYEHMVKTGLFRIFGLKSLINGFFFKNNLHSGAELGPFWLRYHYKFIFGADRVCWILKTQNKIFFYNILILDLCSDFLVQKYRKNNYSLDFWLKTLYKGF